MSCSLASLLTLTAMMSIDVYRVDIAPVSSMTPPRSRHHFRVILDVLLVNRFPERSRQPARRSGQSYGASTVEQIQVRFSRQNFAGWRDDRVLRVSQCLTAEDIDTVRVSRYSSTGWRSTTGRSIFTARHFRFVAPRLATMVEAKIQR